MPGSNHPVAPMRWIIILLILLAGCGCGSEADEPIMEDPPPPAVEALPPQTEALEEPQPPDEIAAAIAAAREGGRTPPLTCSKGCSNYRISKTCCNVFGCNCDGPCWNAGCQTACQQGKYPGRAVSCPGNDGHYNCCPTGSKCKSSKTCSAKSGGCCCTGGGKTVSAISSIEYDFDNATSAPDATALQVSYQYKGINAGPTSAPTGSIDTTVESTQSMSWSFESSTTISASAEVKAGIPFFGDGKLTVGAEETIKYGETRSRTVGTKLQVSAGQDQIPPYSNQAYVFEAEMVQYQIPFTATAVVINDCGEKTTEQITGSTKLSGVASFVGGKFTKIVGPAVPIECKSPFDIPIQEQKDGNFCASGPQCRDNALCVRYGQSGECCAPGSEQPCCAIAIAHARCIEQGYDADRQLCPSSNGNFAPCCNDRAQLQSLYGSPARSGRR